MYISILEYVFLYLFLGFICFVQISLKKRLTCPNYFRKIPCIRFIVQLLRRRPVGYRNLNTL